jgi:glycosyltransferase involved in cell wall biosynthesis
MATRTEQPLTPSGARRAPESGARVAPGVAPGVALTGATPAILDVSVLVPSKDEAANLPILLEQMATAFSGSDVTFEVIIIDDGSVDGSWALLGQLEAQYPFLVRVRHRRCRGISDALRTGYLASRGRVLVFYPADLQYKPEDLPTLVSPILSGWVDMVTGTKKGKYEKAFVSSVYNWLSRQLFSVPVRDLNGVKAYRREVMEVLPIRPDWHRYMIVVAAAEGYSVAEVPIPLYARNAGVSKFNRSRIIVGMLDMLSVWFELRFGRKPLLLFGGLGGALFAIGFLTGIVALALRFFPPYVGFRPLLNLVETCVIVGSVLMVGGLLGEQIAVQRAELREVRRRLDVAATDDIGR